MYKLTIKSNRINDLMKTHHSKKLIKMITKILSSVGVSYNDIMKIISENKSKKNADIIIINQLRKMVKHPSPVYNNEYNIKKAHSKWNMFIERNLKPSMLYNDTPRKFNRILDYGGNVGDFAYVYGEYLGLKKKDIFVVDVNEWAGEKWIPRKDITWVHFDNIDKITSNSIDLITMQHTLHHIKSNIFPDLIRFFNRVLTDNGIIVLYEHNTHNDDMSTIVDLEHLLYDVAATKKNTYCEFLETNYMEYFTIKQWKTIFNKYFISYKIIELNNVDNSFYMFLTKKKQTKKQTNKNKQTKTNKKSNKKKQTKKQTNKKKQKKSNKKSNKKISIKSTY
jgi:SAM-dependent methyltransferase